MRVTIGVPTRDRPRALSRLLASLHAQTYKEWDLAIVDDSTGDMLDVAGEMMLDAIECNGHKVWVTKGVRINQAYSHNHVLWMDQPNEFIMRADDDMILFPDYLEILVTRYKHLESEGHSVGAVSGSILTDHVSSRDDNPPRPTYMHDSVEVGSDGGRLYAPTFMQEYTDGAPIQTEHLYSSYLYRRRAMRQVGGFPLVYSKGVSYHEETDASYRLHLGGYALFLCPGAKAVHSHEGVGGTRLMTPVEHSRRRESDWETFLLRLGKLRGIKSFRPSVCICTQHGTGVGGGQRLTYSLYADSSRDPGEFWLLYRPRFT
jgi:GT2 family glycosyltransferase